MVRSRVSGVSNHAAILPFILRDAPSYSSWPGKSAKRVFALDVPAIHVFLGCVTKNVDARHKAGHDGGLVLQL
ncbi:hypothetical protein ACVWVY_008588 [Bradyrhizobium sp. URHC0002]